MLPHISLPGTSWLACPTDLWCEYKPMHTMGASATMARRSDLQRARTFSVSEIERDGMDLDQDLAVLGHGDLGRCHCEFVQAILACLPLLHFGGHGGECRCIEGAEVRLAALLMDISADVTLE